MKNSNQHAGKKSKDLRLLAIRRAHNAMIREVDQATIADKKLVSACLSQASITAYVCSLEPNCKCSLNTLKKLAEIAIEPGGWNQFDTMRKRIHDTKTGRSTRTHQQAQRAKSELEFLRAKLDTAQRVRANLNRAYLDTLSILRAASQWDEEIAGKLARHFATYSEVLSLRSVSLETNDVDPPPTTV
ncbi:hypothetical protein [Paraburkholderia bannensis]|uniref:hypothetical protein n=1 Tax=Paraburkholderia bannensis TaxID=765414 RepID=UPI002ABE76C2|nr:hypothetical protein [Paraburkholderia bannensis]